METPYKKIVLLGAMMPEIEAFKDHVKEGYWNGKEVYVFPTGVGKIFAAQKTQKVISELSPDAIIFTGVAGSLDSQLEIGQIGVGSASIDAEMDLRPLYSDYKRGEVLFTNERIHTSEKGLVAKALKAPTKETKFDAYIATVSKFLDKEGKREFMASMQDLQAEINGKTRLPNIVEMEGAAVMQVCNSESVPCLALRAVSDSVEGDAPKEFDKFIENSVGNYISIVDYVLKNI